MSARTGALAFPSVVFVPPPPSGRTCQTTTTSLPQNNSTEIRLFLAGMEDGDSLSSSAQQPTQQQCMNVIEKRSKNSDTVDRYIQEQEILLNRLNSSLSYFEELNEAAPEDPHGVFDHIRDPYHDEPGVLEKLENLVGHIFSKHGKEAISSISWDAVPRHSDVSPLRDITASLRLSRCQTVFPPSDTAPQARSVSGTTNKISSQPRSSGPSPYPRPKISPLLCLVRQERARMIDPVLEQHNAYLATLPPDSDDEKRAESPVNSRKKSKHSANAAAAIRPRGPGGLFVKRGAAKSAGTAMQSPSVETAALPFDHDEARLESRSKRVRRKSSRALAAEAGSFASKAKNIDPMSRRSRSLRSVSVASSVQKEAKLTIRIPPLSYLKANHATHPSTSHSIRTTSTTSSSSAGPSTLFADRNTHSPAPSVFTQDGDNSMYARANGNLVGSILPEGLDLNDKQVKDEPYSDDALEEEESINDITLTSDGKGKGKAAKNHTHAGRGDSHPCDDSISNSKSAKGGRKKKTDTFNQQWTDAEQYLLEKLLKDYPDGVRNRWSRISTAMNGRRSPRQVASRVQKYFIKLKKFGLEVK